MLFWIRLILFGVAGLSPFVWGQEAPTDSPPARGPATDLRPALRMLLSHRDPSVQLAVAETLWRLDLKAAEMAPAYVKLLKVDDWKVRAAAAWRLGRLGTDARPAVARLVELSREGHHAVQKQAELALINLGPITMAALPELLRIHTVDANAGEEARPVRLSPAFRILAAMGDEAIPLLIDFDAMRRVYGQENARESMAYLERHPEWIASLFPAFGVASVPRLLKALDSETAYPRTVARLALYEVARSHGLPDSVVPRLDKELENATEAERLVAAKTRMLLRPASEKALAILQESLKPDQLIELLAEASPDNPAALRTLIALLDDHQPETASRAAKALLDLRLATEAMVPVWTKALAHPVPSVREAALEAIQQFGPLAKSATNAVWALRDQGKEHRSKVLWALLRIAPDDPRVLPLWQKLFAEPDGSGRRTALWALSELGPRAGELLPLLEKYLFEPRDRDASYRSGADMRLLIEALPHVAPRSPKVTEILLAVLRRPNLREFREQERGPPKWYLRDILEDTLFATLPASAPTLVEALRDPDVEVRQSAALVLLRAGREAEAALPVLMDASWTKESPSGEEERIHKRTVELLRRRQSGATAAVAQAWCQAWKTARANGRRTLDGGLLVLQPESLPALKEQLRRVEKPQDRIDLACLLAHFDDPPAEVVPVLRAALRREIQSDEQTVLMACKALGPKAAEVAKGDDNPHVRLAGLELLARTKATNAEATRGLVVLLGHVDASVREAAAEACGRLGASARPCVAALKQASDDGSLVVRQAARQTLERVE